MTPPSDRLTTALADRYRVTRELGAGGMATVYLAHDIKHEREVAIKVLHPDLGAALGAERFLSEIKTTAKLQHPHILPLLDSGAADGLLYYVMPYVRGETLRTRLERETQLPIGDALRIAMEVAYALQAAHTLGVVHRDIKPENILLQDGHALVADFGIALAVQTAGGQRMTQTGLSLGTPQYMSPEQAMGERTIDARSDVYALGAVTYEMLTGDAPFTGASVQAIVARVLTERPGSIRAVRDTVAEGVEAAVMTALAKLPADRHASAAAFAAALRAPTVSATTGVAATAVPPAARPRWGGRVAVAVALMATAAGGYAAGRPGAGAARVASSPVLRFPVGIDSPYRATSIGATLLPDGSGIAFIGDGPPGHGMYLRRFADTTFRYLALPDASIGTVPTPDGRALLTYVFTSAGLSRVMILPLNGDPARPWTDSLRYGLAVDEEGWVWGSHHDADGLFRVAPDGARTERLTRPDTTAGQASHRFPILLPKGKGALFSLAWRDGRPIEIGLYDAGSHTVRSLGPGVPNALVDGRYLVYANDALTLLAQRFDVDRMTLVGPAVPLVERASTPSGVFGVVPARSGDALYFLRPPGSWSIVRLDGNTATPWISGRGDDPRNFRLAPDGQSVALETLAGIEFRTGDGSVRRLPLAGSVTLAGYLPDGSGVTFTRDRSQGGASAGVPVEVAPADGSLTPRRLDNGTTALPTVSAGTLVGIGSAGVVLVQKRETFSELRFVPRDGAPAVRIAESGGSPAIAPDGRFVAWTRSSSDPTTTSVVMVSALPPATGSWEVGAGSTPRWSADARTLYFTEPRISYDTRPSAILKVTVGAGAAFAAGPVSVAAAPPANATSIWDVGRDGRIYWLTSTAQQQIVFVHNFAHLVDSLVTQAGATAK
ncbi:MAG: protein kinase [Gemmatimonas sp.]|nr:protein kinase [Gemmatimonas sp.]